MKNFRTLFFLISILGFAISACSNNSSTSTDPNASTTTTVTASSNLAFLGIADGARVEIEFFDDYLSKVLNGNPYNNGNNIPPLASLYMLPFQILISGFNYYDKTLDVLCDKDNYNNRVLSYLKGTLPNGHQALFAMSTDGSFYVCDTTLTPACPASVWTVQGPQDEIGTIEMLDGTFSGGVYTPYNPTYQCTGTDSNDYLVTLYGDYTRNGVSINDSFDVKTAVFSGVISVQIKDYNDPAIYLFVR